MKRSNPTPRQLRRMARYGKLQPAPNWKTTRERLAEMRDYCAENEIDATQMIEDAIDTLIYLGKMTVKTEVTK